MPKLALVGFGIRAGHFSQRRKRRKELEIQSLYQHFFASLRLGERLTASTRGTANEYLKLGLRIGRASENAPLAGQN